MLISAVQQSDSVIWILGDFYLECLGCCELTSIQDDGMGMRLLPSPLKPREMGFKEANGRLPAGFGWFAHCGFYVLLA